MYSIWKGITLHFLRLETPPYDDTQSRTDIKTRENCGKELYNVWIHFSPTCRQNLNINVVITIYCQQNSIFLKQKNIQNSIHYLTGQNRCLSRLKNHDRRPAVRYFQPCREQYARSNGATARLLTLVKPAETLARNWPNTNRQREMVMSLSAIYRWNIKLAWTCDMYYVFWSTDYYQWLTLESWFRAPNYNWYGRQCN